jgi:acetolactate synthase I/II/III large subunit
MLVADAVANFLADKGCKRAFGLIGGGNFVLMDAITRRGYTKITPMHHEQAAAMAATYYYRTCRQIAPVLVTTGGGSTNSITGVMAAYMDSIPLLVISGNEASKYMDDKTRVLGVQGYESAELGLQFTKLSQTLMHANRVIRILDVSVRKALEHRQGPVWVNIPRDVALMEVQ